MRRLSVLPLLAVIGLGLLTLSSPWAMAAAARTLSSAAGCQPVITGWTTFKAGLNPDFTIHGTCFGTGGAFRATDSNDFRVSVFPGGTTLSQARSVMALRPGTGVPYWNGCSARADTIDDLGHDLVTCTVSDWSNTSATLASFGTTDGGFYVNVNADLLAVQIWNANTLAGPAIIYIRTGATATAVGHSEVSSIGASLATPSKAFPSLSSVVIDALITVLLALFLTFPAHLFNSTFEENYADIVAWRDKWANMFLPLDLRRAVVADFRKGKAFLLGHLDLAGRAGPKRFAREQVSSSPCSWPGHC